MEGVAVPERYVAIGKRPRTCESCKGVFYSDSLKTKTHPGKCAYEYRSASLAGLPVDEWRVAMNADAQEPLVEKTRPSAWVDEPSGAEAVRAFMEMRQPRPSPVTGYRRVMFWPDTHLPYQDKRAVDLALKIADYFKPELLILLGDILDAAGFSRFDHDASDPKSFFQTELNEWHGLARAISHAAPDAEKLYLLGNHEARIQKWLWKNPQLKGYEGLDLANALKLGDHGFDHKVHEELDLCQGQLTVRHGTFLGGSTSGAAARLEMQRAGTSGVSGHVHRAAQYIQRDKRGLRVWIESGHLAENPPHYAPTIQNWCQAVTVGEISRDENDFSLELVPFRLSYKARVYGKELSA